MNTKIIIFCLIVASLLSGCIDQNANINYNGLDIINNTVKEIDSYINPETKIFGATPDEQQIILNALNQTDIHIRSVTILPGSTLFCDYPDEAVGCTTSVGRSQFDIELVHAYIYGQTETIGDITYYTGGSFENTLYHEIGHVVCINEKDDYSESCADEYESDITINHREKLIHGYDHSTPMDLYPTDIEVQTIRNDNTECMSKTPTDGVDGDGNISAFDRINKKIQECER